jgi:hypothetical protein
VDRAPETRCLADLIAFCKQYEFEDMVAGT